MPTDKTKGTVFLKVLFFVIILLLLLLPGYILRKVNLIKEGTVGSFVSVLLYVCSPMLIFRSLFYQKATIENPLEPNLLLGFGIMFVLAFVAIVAVFFLAKLVFLKRQDKNAAHACTFAAVFGNVGFIGIPFVQFVLQGNALLPYALLYAAVFNVVFNVLCWTLGVFIITGSLKDLRPLNILLNPVVIVTLIALPLFFLRVDLPQVVPPIADVITFLGNMTTPLSMIIVGIRLAGVPIASLFTNGWAYVTSFLRLIVAPLFAFGLIMLLRAVGLFGDLSGEFYLTYGKAICAVIIILAALPVAASTIAFCERNGGDSATAVKTFMNSTFLAIVTMPILVSLLYGCL